MSNIKAVGIVIIAVAIIALMAVSLVYAVTPSFSTDNYSTDIYIVEKGDTLWSIGSKYCKESDDIRDWIRAVSELNETTSLIYPGQNLTIYVEA